MRKYEVGDKVLIGTTLQGLDLIEGLTGTIESVLEFPDDYDREMSEISDTASQGLMVRVSLDDIIARRQESWDALPKEIRSFLRNSEAAEIWALTDEEVSLASV